MTTETIKIPKILYEVQAINDWHSEIEEEISFNAFDRISVLQDLNDWWFGFKSSSEKTKLGFFPRNYVQQIEKTKTRTSPKKKKKQKPKPIPKHKKEPTNTNMRDDKNETIKEKNEKIKEKKEKKEKKVPLQDNNQDNNQDKNQDKKKKKKGKQLDLTKPFLTSNFTWWETNSINNWEFRVELIKQKQKIKKKKKYLVVSRIEIPNSRNQQKKGKKLYRTMQSEYTMKDFQELRSFLCNYKPLAVPLLKTDRKDVNSCRQIEKFLTNIQRHPVLSQSDIYLQFLGTRNSKEWSEIQKQTVTLMKKWNFFQEMQAEHPTETLQSNYDQIVNSFQAFLSSFEKKIKNSKSSWSRLTVNQQSFGSIYHELSTFFESISQVDWRKGYIVNSIKNSDHSDMEKFSVLSKTLSNGFLSVSQIWENVNDQNGNAPINYINDILDDILSMSEIFKRLKDVKKVLESQKQSVQNLQKAKNLDNEKIKIEEEKLAFLKRGRILFQLALLAEIELFKFRLLTNLKTLISEYSQSVINNLEKWMASFSTPKLMSEDLVISKGVTYSQYRNKK